MTYNCHQMALPLPNTMTMHIILVDRVFSECTFSMKTPTLLFVDHAMTSHFAVWLLLFPKALPHRFHLAKSFGDRKVDRPSTKSTDHQQSRPTINKVKQRSTNSTNNQKTQTAKKLCNFDQKTKKSINQKSQNYSITLVHIVYFFDWTKKSIHQKSTLYVQLFWSNENPQTQ